MQSPIPVRTLPAWPIPFWFNPLWPIPFWPILRRLSCLCVLLSVAQAQSRPNILLIVAEDNGPELG